MSSDSEDNDTSSEEEDDKLSNEKTANNDKHTIYSSISNLPKTTVF